MSDFSSGKRNRTLELNKALTVMGFGTWNSLEPGKYVHLVETGQFLAFQRPVGQSFLAPQWLYQIRIQDQM